MVRTAPTQPRTTAFAPAASAARPPASLGGGGSWRRWLWLAGALTASALAAIAVALSYEPAALRAVAPGLSSGSAIREEDALRLSGRLITTASALRAAAVRPGTWDAVVTDDEVNAWLGHDLPRNHPRLLPAGWSAPRVAFADDRCWLGVRRWIGPVPALVWVRAEVRPRDGGAIELAVDGAGLGGLPLPGDALLARIGSGLRRAGLSVTVGRLDGANRLLVHLTAGHSASAGIRLGGVRFRDGEALVTGQTVAAAPRQ